jgi:hypothetical protein
MRTTLTIDDDVLQAARALATARGESLGAVVSELARRGLKPSAPVAYREEFPVFEVGEDAPVFGPDEVNRALDDE